MMASATKGSIGSCGLLLNRIPLIVLHVTGTRGSGSKLIRGEVLLMAAASLGCRLAAAINNGDSEVVVIVIVGVKPLVVGSVESDESIELKHKS